MYIVGRALIRSHALRCFSVLLSDEASRLQQRPQRSQQSNLANLPALLSEVLMMSVGVGISVRALDAFAAVSEPYLAELASELRASRLLEHWARLVLLLGGCEGVNHEQCASIVESASGHLILLFPNNSELLHDSPCLSYLLAAHTVRLCAVLDGGTTYGMPMNAAASIVATPPLLLEEGPPAAPQQRPGVTINTVTAQWTLLLWAHAITAGRDELLSALLASLEAVMAAGAGGNGWRWQMEWWRLQVRPVRLHSAATEAAEGAQGCAAVGSRPDAREAEARATPSSNSSAAAGQEGPSAAPEPPPALQRWVGCAAVPPLHTRAAFEVSLRVSAAAVAAMEAQQQDHGGAAAARGGGTSSGGSGGGDRPRVRPPRAGALASAALGCAYAAYVDVAQLPRVPPWVQQRMERYWRLLLAAIRCGVQAAVTSGQRAHGADGKGALGEAWSWDALADQLARLHGPAHAVEALPPGPTPDVSAALSAGYLPAVERLMRRPEEAARLRIGGGGSRRLKVPADYVESSAAWGQLLAYGPRDAVFSLLATAAKRLRRALTGRDELPGVFLDGGCAVQLLVSAAPLRWLLQAAEAEASGAGGDGAREAAAAQAAPSRAIGGGGGGSEGPGLPQLRSALSFIALHLVLPLCGPILTEPCSVTTDITPELLGWLPLLAAARAQPAWAGHLPADLGCSQLLGAALAQAAADLEDGFRRRLLPALREALAALLHLAPELLPELLPGAEALARDMLAATAAVEPTSEPAGGEARSCADGPEFPLLLLRLLGPGGAAPDPQLLAALEAAAAGSGAGSGNGAGLAARHAVTVERLTRLVPLLPTPAEVAAALPPLCSNPHCTNLAGDTEAGLPLPAVCAGRSGGRLPYCSEGCRKQHRGGEGLQVKCGSRAMWSSKCSARRCGCC